MNYYVCFTLRDSMFVSCRLVSTHFDFGWAEFGEFQVPVSIAMAVLWILIDDTGNERVYGFGRIICSPL